MQTTPKKFLIVKIAAIGDVIMATSMITALREEHPGCHISWMVGAAAHGMLALIPGIDRLIAVDDKALLAGSRLAQIMALLEAWKTVAFQTYDLIIIAHHDRRYSLLAATALGPKRSMTSGLRGGLIAGRHHSVEYARLATARDGPTMSAGQLPTLDPAVFRDAHPLPVRTKPYAVLAPGGAKNVMRDSPQRRWPTENYAEIARALLARGLDVILVGAATDDWVLPYFDGIAVTDMIGKTSWPGLFALIAAARLILTHDSMMAHLPRLFAVPTFTLFGPTSPNAFFFSNKNFHLIQADTDLPCRPCYDGKNFLPCAALDCMRRISPQSVLEALDLAIN